MTRRGDPEKIYQAQRYGIFRRLVDEERVNELDAEHWIARWEREAEATGQERGSTGYWDAAWEWIVATRGSGPSVHRILEDDPSAIEHRLRLRERLRAEWIAGAEEEWRRRTGGGRSKPTGSSP